jgi:hypothetical protein
MHRDNFTNFLLINVFLIPEVTYEVVNRFLSYDNLRAGGGGDK